MDIQFKLSEQTIFDIVDGFICLGPKGSLITVFHKKFPMSILLCQIK